MVHILKTVFRYPIHLDGVITNIQFSELMQVGEGALRKGLDKIIVKMQLNKTKQKTERGGFNFAQKIVTEI